MYLGGAGLSLPNRRGRKSGRDTFLTRGKNSNAITLLQEGSQLTLAVLLKVAAFVLPFKAIM